MSRKRSSMRSKAEEYRPKKYFTVDEFIVLYTLSPKIIEEKCFKYTINDQRHDWLYIANNTSVNTGFSGVGKDQYTICKCVSFNGQFIEVRDECKKEDLHEAKKVRIWTEDEEV